MKRKIKCNVCPNHCDLTVEIDDEDEVLVDGNRCMKGMIYATGEALRWSDDENN